MEAATQVSYTWKSSEIQYQLLRKAVNTHGEQSLKDYLDNNWKFAHARPVVLQSIAKRLWEKYHKDKDPVVKVIKEDKIYLFTPYTVFIYYPNALILLHTFLHFLYTVSYITLLCSTSNWFPHNNSTPIAKGKGCLSL